MGQQNIGNLSATITANAQQLIDEFRRAQDAMDRGTDAIVKSADKSVAGFEKGFLRIALGTHVYGLLRQEIIDTIKNIDNIPGISPEVLDSVHRLKFAFESSNGSIKSAIATMAASFTYLAESLGFVTGGLIYGFDSAQAGFNLLNQEAADFAAKKYNEEIAKITRELGQMRLSASQLGEALILEMHDLNAFAVGTAGTQQERWDASVKAGKDLIEVQRVLNALRKEDQAAVDQLARTDRHIGNIGANRDESLKTLMAQRDALALQKYQFSQNNIGKTLSPTDAQILLDIDKKRLDVNQQIIPLLEKQQNEFNQIAKVIGDDLTKAFVDVMSGAKSGFSDLGKEILLEIEKIITKLLIVAPLMHGLGSAFSSVGGSFFSSLGTAFSHYAGGGDPTIGVPSLVGEEGPELFIPKSSGTILPAGATRGLMSGGAKRAGDSYFIDATGADPAKIGQLESFIRSVHGSVERRSVAAVIAAKRKGGGTAAALRT